MQLSTLYVSQRRLRNPGQIPAFIHAIRAGDPLPPVRLSEDDDGSIQVEDGHHRITAFWLAGKHCLTPQDYLLLPVSEHPRPRFGQVPEFVRRNAPLKTEP